MFPKTVASIKPQHRARGTMQQLLIDLGGGGRDDMVIRHITFQRSNQPPAEDWKHIWQQQQQLKFEKQRSILLFFSP